MGLGKGVHERSPSLGESSLTCSDAGVEKRGLSWLGHVLSCNMLRCLLHHQATGATPAAP